MDTERKKYRPISEALLAILMAMHLSLLINVLSAYEEEYFWALVLLVLALFFIALYAWKSADIRDRILRGLETSKTSSTTSREKYENSMWADPKLYMRPIGIIALLLAFAGFMLFAEARIELYSKNTDDGMRQKEEQLLKHNAVIDSLTKVIKQIEVLENRLEQHLQTQSGVSSPQMKPVSGAQSRKQIGKKD